MIVLDIRHCSAAIDTADPAIVWLVIRRPQHPDGP
jgi:hypothetical protein